MLITLCDAKAAKKILHSRFKSSSFIFAVLFINMFSVVVVVLRIFFEVTRGVIALLATPELAAKGVIPP